MNKEKIDAGVKYGYEKPELTLEEVLSSDVIITSPGGNNETEPLDPDSDSP